MTSIQHPNQPQERLFLLFDTTHNMKNIFNNWVNKRIFALPGGFQNLVNEGVVDFQHIKDLFRIEEDCNLKIAHKLSLNSLNPNNIAHTSPVHSLGMRIYMCYQSNEYCVFNSRDLHVVYFSAIFSESTAAGLDHYAGLYPAWRNTAKFVKFILNIWKVVSVKSPSKGE